MDENEPVRSVNPAAIVLYQQLRSFDTKQGKGGDPRIELNITVAVEKYWEAKRSINVMPVGFDNGKIGPCPDCSAHVTSAHHFCHKCGRRLMW